MRIDSQPEMNLFLLVLLNSLQKEQNIFPSSADNHGRPSFHFSLNFNTRTLIITFRRRCFQILFHMNFFNFRFFRLTGQKTIHIVNSRLIGKRNAGARHICCLCHAHCKDCIILLLLSRVWKQLCENCTSENDCGWRNG